MRGKKQLEFIHFLFLTLLTLYCMQRECLIVVAVSGLPYAVSN
jgi:hypothetical protein